MSAAFQHLLEKGDLEELIRRALLDPDIKESLEYSSLSSGAIRETLGKNFDEAITAVREEASVFEELKSQADYLLDKWLSTIVPFCPTCGSNTTDSVGLVHVLTRSLPSAPGCCPPLGSSYGRKSGGAATTG